MEVGREDDGDICNTGKVTGHGLKEDGVLATKDKKGKVEASGAEGIGTDATEKRQSIMVVDDEGEECLRDNGNHIVTYMSSAVEEAHIVLISARIVLWSALTASLRQVRHRIFKLGCFEA